MAKKSLNDSVCRNAKPTEKVQKLSDGGGLHLQITPDGSKYWRMHYRFNEKQKTLAFGVYPDVSLAEARDKRAEAKALLKQGIDPSEEKKKVKYQKKLDNTNTFETIAREWHVKQEKNLSSDYWKNQLHRLEAVAELNGQQF